MTSYAVQRTTIGAPAIRALIAELDADLHRRYDRVQDAYDGFNILPADTRTVIVLDGDTPVGCGCIKLFDPATVEIKRVFVSPAARRRGVARTIMDALETWARELGVTAAILETGYLQHEAIALYERIGYTRIAAFGPYAEAGMDSSICMRKPL
jgi:GNAT superfamily N-acetyltransferase